MVAFTYRMGAGYPGTVNRTENLTVETQYADMALPFSAFGLPGAIGSNGKFRPMAAGDAAAAVYGWLQRIYPNGSSQDPLGVSTPSQYNVAYPGSGEANVMVRGYMVVKLQGSTAAVKNAPVFIRLAGTVPTGGTIGGVEAAADSTNTIQVPNAAFMGPADANGITEIRFNI